MGITESILGFAKECYNSIKKEKGPNYFKEVYSEVGNAVKESIAMDEASKKERAEKINGENKENAENER